MRDATLTELRPVLGFEDSYSISNEGDLFRTKQTNGTTLGAKRKPQFNARGYVTYMLSVGSKVSTHRAHRLVWEAFNGKIPRDMTINHKNGIKTDNRLENLEIVSRAENTIHAIEVLDSYFRGEQVHIAKLSEKDIPAICAEYAQGGISHRALATKYGVTSATIFDVLHRKSWAHVSR